LAKAIGAALRDRDVEVRLAALRVARRAPTLDDDLEALADEVNETAIIRLQALSAIVDRRPDRSPASIALLLDRLGPGGSVSERLTSAEILGRSRLDDASLARALKRARDDVVVSPSVLAPMLARSTTATTAPKVVEFVHDTIDRGWRPDPVQSRPLIDRLARVAPDRAKDLQTMLATINDPSAARLREFLPLVAGGDAHRGRVVFFSPKATCSACHRIGDDGGAIGPDLTRIGASRAPRDLLEAILVPGAAFAQGYESYVVETTDGQQFVGMIARSGAEAITLRDSAGNERTIPQTAIEQARRSSTSIMPEGLERNLTRDELRDLVAFLASLK
jgi:putative heme-binding domain-containing protein